MMRADRKKLLSSQLFAITEDMEIEEVLIRLQSSGVITDQIVDRIKCCSTPQSGRHELVKTLKTRGDKAFDQFFLALLHSRQTHLANSLRCLVSKEILDTLENGHPSFVSPSNNQPQTSKFMGGGDFISSAIEPSGILYDLHVDLIDGDAQVVPELEFFERKKDQVYSHFSAPKGLALIINNKKFDGMPERTGTDVDCSNLENLFRQLGYLVRVECDLRSKEMFFAVREFAQDARHGQSSSVVLCVLTHGEHDQLLGVDDQPVSVHHLLQQLNAINCPALAGKPKVILFQACRGERKDHGFDGTDSVMARVDADIGLFNFFSCVQPGRQIETRRSRHPVESDFLIAYATPPFHVSWRNSLRGSWFIQSICEIFARHSRDTHIVDMLTMVNKKVAEFETGGRYKQQPEMHCRLRKQLYFFPGLTR